MIHPGTTPQTADLRLERQIMIFFLTTASRDRHREADLCDYSTEFSKLASKERPISGYDWGNITES